MKVTQEKLPASQIGLEIEIPADKSQKAYDKVVQNLAKTAVIPGFRPGKVPRPILLQRMGVQRIKAAALEELIQDSLKAAIAQEDIASLGNYRLRSNFEQLIEQYQPGKPLTFSAAVDIVPEVTLGDYHNLSVKAEEVPYDPEHSQDFLNQQRDRQATLVPVEDRPAQLGDIAVVDFQAQTPEGEAIADVSGQEFQVEMEVGKVIAGFVEGIVGMSLEETKPVSVTFPASYPREDLAGKDVVFMITLTELKEKELPDLDDDFAQEISEFETMAELKEAIEQQFRDKAEQATKNNIFEALKQELVRQSQSDPPSTLIDEQVDRILTQTAVQMEEMGIDVKQVFNADSIPQLREKTRPDAIEIVKRDLAIAEVAKREGLEPAPEEIASRMQALAAQLDRDYDPDRLRELIEEELREQKTLEWLRERAAVELVPPGTLESEAATETFLDDGTDITITVTEDQDETVAIAETNPEAVDGDPAVPENSPLAGEVTPSATDETPEANPT